MWQKNNRRDFSLTITYRERYFTSEAMKIRTKNGKEIRASNGLCLGLLIHVSRKTGKIKDNQINNVEENFSTQANVDLLELFFLVEIFVDN